jgi:anti-sigma regulatory factor (Ser/Thr protein kinase)
VFRAVELSLAAQPASAAVARDFLRQTVRERTSSERLDAGALIVSELVTNAVMHGTAPIRLELHLGLGELRVDVFDAAPAEDVAIHRDGVVDDTSGRGLRIVENLADAWGVRSCGGEKCVWATIHV